MLAVFLGFLALGAWQVKRLFWKLDLIERVDRRVHAAPVAAPGIDAWPTVTAGSHEYLHVRLSGTFLYAKTARVQALSRLGAGFWLLTPLRGADGVTTLVNRGFIAGGAHDEKEGQPMRLPMWSVCCASASRMAASCARTTLPRIVGFRATSPPSRHRGSWIVSRRISSTRKTRVARHRNSNALPADKRWAA